MKHKKLKIFGHVICVLFLIFSAMLFVLQLWLFRTWATMSGSELLYHMQHSLKGANMDMVKGFVIKFIGPVIILLVLLVLLVLYLRKKDPPWFKYRYWAYLAVAIVLFGISVYRIEVHSKLFSTIKNYIVVNKFGSDKDFIKDNYVNPKDVKLTFPEKKRNLIYLYLESMEDTYTDKASGGDFEKNCIPELTKIGKESQDFSGDSDKLNGGIPLEGSTWTSGAMFAQQSGLPLQIPFTGSEMHHKDTFFPGIITIGDILKDQGYNQMLLIGSNAAFAGRNHLYKQHGDYTIHDYRYALKEGIIPEDYHVFWGYEDEKLFAIAKNELTALAAQDQPFNLTMLTVDTHFQDGYVCRLCKKEFGKNQYANVMACSSRQVADFIDWIKQQDFYKDTTIVISGDHCTMDNDFCENVDPRYTRKTFTAIINGTAEPVNDKKREYATMDLFPTTLAAMGVDIAGNKLGLGVNLYSDEKTLVERYGKDLCDTYLAVPSKFLQEYNPESITTEDLDKIKEGSGIWVGNHNGELEITLWDLRVISTASIKGAELEVIDKKTGKVKDTYVMKVSQQFNNPNASMANAVTDFAFEKASDYDYAVYMDVIGGIKHYKIMDSREDESLVHYGEAEPKAEP